MTTLPVKPTTHVGKVLRSTSPHTWAQCYHAGTVFALFALTTTPQHDTDLAHLGKELIATFEGEYFTLEEKTLATIKDALQTTLTKIPEGVNATVALLTSPPTKPDVVYIYSLGEANVLLRRDKHVGILTTGTQTLSAHSGRLHDHDMVILSFGDTLREIEKETLLKTSPIDLAETITASLPATEDLYAAFFISFHFPQQTEAVLLPHEEKAEHLQEELPQRILPIPIKEKHQRKIPFPTLRLPHISLASLSHKQKLLLSVAVIIGLVLIMSVIVSQQKKQAVQSASQFQQIYTSAQKKYEEGKALVTLNKPLANESFKEAKHILEEGQGNVHQGEEQEKITKLLAEVSASLEDSTGAVRLEAKPATARDSQLLTKEKDTAGAIDAVEDEDSLFILTPEQVTIINKETEKTSQLKKNWATPKAIGVFGTNMYILDTKEDTVSKFGPTGSGYGKSSYFSGAAPTLSTAVDMAIDGSVWILLSDGTLLKFTKGKQELFSLTGLDKPLKSPTKLFTTAESMLYIIDSGNKRLVVMDKKGVYQAQYIAETFASVDDFVVSERDKAVLVLTDGKLVRFDLP